MSLVEAQAVCPDRPQAMVEDLLDAACSGDAKRVRAMLREEVPFAVTAD